MHPFLALISILSFSMQLTLLTILSQLTHFVKIKITKTWCIFYFSVSLQYFMELCFLCMVFSLFQYINRAHEIFLICDQFQMWKQYGHFLLLTALYCCQYNTDRIIWSKLFIPLKIFTAFFVENVNQLYDNMTIVFSLPQKKLAVISKFVSNLILPTLNNNKVQTFYEFPFYLVKIRLIILYQGNVFSFKVSFFIRMLLNLLLKCLFSMQYPHMQFLAVHNGLKM